MYARAVDEAAVRRGELRHEEWANLGLATLALGLAAAATEMRPALAMPLFLGGLVAWALGVRALWRRWDLVDRLSGERDTYLISEVRAHASREATMDRRRIFEALIVSRLREPLDERIAAAAAELEALANELDDDDLALDPASAVACWRLLSHVDESPLLNPALPHEELRSRVRQIRSGFHPRRLVA
jgi:hypothetical protein